MFIWLDIPRNNQLFFQDTATPTMSGIIDLHQHVFFFIIFIFFVVAFQIFDVLAFFKLEKALLTPLYKNKSSFYNNFSYKFYDDKDDFFSKQLIYGFYGYNMYFHVLDPAFEKNNNFLISYVKTKYYFELLKTNEFNEEIEFKNQLLNLIKNIPLLTNNKKIQKELILKIVNKFLIIQNNSSTKKFNFSSLSTFYGGFALYKNFENELKKSLVKLSLISKIHKFNHNTMLETIWTLIPISIVLAIAIPSFILMYALDAALDGVITIKAIGHQWYWSYECEFPDVLNYLEENLNSDNVNMLNIYFDSYMIYTDQLKKGEIRLLDVDKALFLPFRVPLDIVITSVDVIHSWAVPSLGVKVDAVPGRLNHIGVFIERKGIFYGQCSELCGVNHGFMPIKVIAVSYPDYINYCYSIFMSSSDNLDKLLKISRFF